MSRPATSRLKVNPVLGHRPSLEFRRLDELEIDTDYQRTIATGTSQTLIRRIAMFWDWGLCQPLTVARRADGRLMVVDGQHRLAAARMRNDIHDLPCVITSYDCAGDEAAAFVALNQQRRPLTKLDLFKAASAAEDNDALAILDLLKQAGLKLAGHTNYTAWKPGMVSNISGIQNSFRIHGPKITLAALTALARAFEGEVLRYAGSLFPGIAGFMAEQAKAGKPVSIDDLVSTLRKRTQRAWLTEIQFEAAASGTRRDVAARITVKNKHLGITSTVTAMPKTLTLPPERASVMTWCNQCDRRVTLGQAAACQSPFCKAKAEVA